MGFTKFKLLTQRLLSGLGKSKSFFPFYDSENDADYRVSLDTLITFISNELGVSSKAVFELTGISNTGNNYISTLDISSYKTEGLYIFKPSTDSDDVTTLNVNSVGTLDIKEFDGTSLVDKTDLKAVNTYLLLYKTSYWLIVGGVSGEHPNPTSYLAHATVDGINGDDSYAELNNPKRPYLTITAAQDALKLAIITTISSPVQCKGFCYVKQGVYFDEYLINRQYVDMHFEYGAIVISDTDGKPVISDTDGNDEPVNINIAGQGQFYHTRYNPQGLDNQAVALSNSDSREFNFEAYEVDGIQIYGGNSITTKLNVKNTRIRYTIFVGNKKSIHFEKCKFLSGLDLDNFFHDDNEITCNECEFIVPSDNLDSLVEIRDLGNNLIDTIDVSSGVQSGGAFQFGSGTRLELQNSHVGAHYHSIISGIYICNTWIDGHGNPPINNKYSITNSKIRIQKDGGIGISIIQTCEANLSQPEHPNWIFRDIQIEDETENKTTTALVAKKRDTLSTTIPYMFASIISNCEITIGSGYEAGYIPIEPSYEFVPVDPPVPDLSGYIPLNGTELINGSFKTPLSGLKRSEFAITPTLINLESGTSTDSSKLNLNDVEIIQAVNLSSVYLGSRFFQIKGGLPYLFKFDILKIEGLTHAEIAAKINAEPYGLITRQYADDKYIHVVIVANDFIAENNKIYHTIGSLTVTDPTPIGGSGYDVLIMSTNVVVGGVTYSIAGTYIRRRYVGGVWISYLSTGETNLGYTPSPTNGIVTSDTGTDATLTLVDGTNAGLVSPSMQSTWDGKQDAITFGTGTLTVLGVNVGSVGSIVVNGGVLGTPSSGTLTNVTGLPISTGVSGLGTGVATYLTTPTITNFGTISGSQSANKVLASPDGTSGNISARDLKRKDLKNTLTTIGTVGSDDYSVDYLASRYTRVGSNIWTVSSNKLNIAGGSTKTLGNYIGYNYYGKINSKKLSLSIDIIVGTISATSFGVGLGIQGASLAIQGAILLDSTNQGRLAFYFNNDTVTEDISEGALSLSAGDVINLRYTLLQNSLILVATNTTLSTRPSITYTKELINNNSTTYRTPNAGFATIYSLGGSHGVDNLAIVNNASKYPKILFIDDSKGAGSHQSNEGQSYTSFLARKINGQIESLAGGGNYIADANSVEILAYEADLIFIAVGTNDVIRGDSAATIMASYATLESSLTGYTRGVNLFYVNLPPNNTVSTTTVNTSMATTFGDDVCKIYSTFVNYGATTIQAKYSNDGTHLNAEGKRIQANIIYEYGLRKGLWQTGENPNMGGNEIHSNGAFTALGGMNHIPQYASHIYTYNKGSQFGISPTYNGNDGLGMWSTSSGHAVLAAGCNTFDGSSITNTHTSPMRLSLNSGDFKLSSDTGLTIGNTLTPTNRLQYTNSSNTWEQLNSYAIFGGNNATTSGSTIYRQTNAGAALNALVMFENGVTTGAGATSSGFGTGGGYQCYIGNTDSKKINIANFSFGGTSTAGSEDGYVVITTKSAATGTLEAMRLNASQNVGIGTGTNIVHKLDVWSSTAGNGIRNYNTTTPSSYSGGLFLGQSPLATAANQRQLALAGGGYDGTNSFASTRIQSFSSQSQSLGTAQGGYITIETTPSGTAALTERMRISDNGNVGIGTANPQSRLSVTSGLAVGSTYAGTNAAPTDGAIIQGNVGIGISAPTSKLQIAAGTLTDGVAGVSISATMPTIMAVPNSAIDVAVTATGSSNFNTNGIRINFFGGYTGSARTATVNGTNGNTGVGNDIMNIQFNVGLHGNANGTTVGKNVGVQGICSNANYNVGGYFAATTAKNSATNIGIVGIARNTGTSPTEVGGWIGLGTADPSSLISAGLIVDNSSVAAPIFLARDNGTIVFTIADGGGVTLLDGSTLTLGATTGVKIGATGDKIGFLGATAIVRPTTAIAASTFTANTSLIANDTATFDGYTIGQVVKALRNLGLLN